jgi:hypothetical protein
MSAEGRARIAEAQRKRWALRKAAVKVTEKAEEKSTKTKAPRPSKKAANRAKKKSA